MNPFKSKQRFKKLSIFVLVPYIVLSITAGGFHALDGKAFHGHADSHQSENAASATNKDISNTPIICDNDH
ncbi:MAG: hypothetical protein ACYSR0_12275, partial [Planctomycetota bacterium]